MLRNSFRKLTGHSYPLSIPKAGYVINLCRGIPKPSSFNLKPSTGKKTFTFLNQSHTFEGLIDWNISKYGKLWAYNLNYFDYLHQPEITREEGLSLIREFIDRIETNKEGLEPYPISLRGINWIRFLSKHNIWDKQIDAALYAQYQILMDNLEYHVLGNHLLENGISLLFGAFYFRDNQLWQKASKIISSELAEQILEDGGHFERSVMYHCIMMERLLIGYNLLQNNNCFKDQEKFEKKLADNLRRMGGWLEQMAWANGDLPELNDHLPEMTPSFSEIRDYADCLGLGTNNVNLGVSGYRKYQEEKYELIVDAGNIGPDYVPGHAHSDLLSFLLRIDGQEIITDTGTSTYENNQRRQIERSTSSHNTVMACDKEQNEVWSAFRIGRRGHTRIIFENDNKIVAQHDGYQFIGLVHERTFELNTDKIIVKDRLIDNKEKSTGSFFLHFYPGIKVNQSENLIEANDFIISFTGHSSIDLVPYEKAVGYNKCCRAIQANVYFTENLITEIKLVSHSK